MVAMNPQTWDKDVACDRAGRLPVLRFDQADAGVEIPRRHRRARRAADRDLQSRLHRPAPAPAVQEHHLCRRALRPARHRARGDRDAVRRAVQGQGKADRRQPHALHLGRDWVLLNMEPRPGRSASAACRSSAPTRSATASISRATRPPRSAPSMAARRCAPGIRSRRRPRWPTPSPSYCAKLRTDPDTGKAKYAIIQGEDEIASIGIVVGAGWNGARAFTATSGPGISLMQEFCRPRLFRRNSRR